MLNISISVKPRLSPCPSGCDANLLDTASFTNGAQNVKLSLNALPEFSPLSVSNPMLASIPPVPASTSAVTKSWKATRIHCAAVVRPLLTAGSPTSVT